MGIYLQHRGFLSNENVTIAPTQRSASDLTQGIVQETGAKSKVGNNVGKANLSFENRNDISSACMPSDALGVVMVAKQL